jgi:signal peptidase I
MQSQLPQGSFILVRRVQPELVREGDDITFMRADGNIVTHRVVRIFEDYESSGLRGFVTKGTENQLPDPDIAYSDNVLGVVVFHSVELGIALGYIRTHGWVVIGLIVIATCLILTLQRMFRTRR